MLHIKLMIAKIYEHHLRQHLSIYAIYYYYIIIMYCILEIFLLHICWNTDFKEIEVHPTVFVFGLNQFSSACRDSLFFVF